MWTAWGAAAVTTTCMSETDTGAGDGHLTLAHKPNRQVVIICADDSTNAHYRILECSLLGYSFVLDLRGYLYHQI